MAQKHVKIRCRTVRNCHEKPIGIKAGNVPITIYRVSSRGYRSFIVTYYSAGKRKRESFSDLTRAKDRANEIAQAIINDRLAVLELSSADRDGYVRATALLPPFGIPLHSAIEEYVAARSLLNGQPLVPTLQEYIGRRRNVIDKPVREIVDELIESNCETGGHWRRKISCDGWRRTVDENSATSSHYHATRDQLRKCAFANRRNVKSHLRLFHSRNGKSRESISPRSRP